MTVSRYYYYYFSAGAADPPVAAAGLEINPVFLLAAPGDAETLLANQTYLYAAAAAAAAVARITFPSSHFSPMWPLLVSSIGYGQRTRTAN